jgi:FkbM family methyltransferase
MVVNSLRADSTNKLRGDKGLAMDRELRKHVIESMAKADLPAAWRNFLFSPNPAILFGAGRQAAVVYIFCLMLGKPVHCLMTSGSRARWGYLPDAEDLPLYTHDEFPADRDKKGLDVVIAMNSAHNGSVSDLLRRDGWSGVAAVDNWEKVNAVTREAFFRAYLLWRGGRFVVAPDGAVHVECPFRDGMFKIHYDIDPVYNANLLGEFGNIVLPSIFDDFSLAGIIGPYEYGGAVLRRGNRVLALGANIGLFSCVAAAKGCIVDAFEPNPDSVRYLRKNAELYPHFTIIPKAVLETPGITDFFTNSARSESVNLARGSVFREIEPSYSRIAVEATSIDAYVEQNGIDRVDFIKSHAEYAETRLLSGAHEVLRRFSPRLAIFCQDNEKGDKQKIYQTILLRANPRYVLSYKWRRLFAWVP